MNDLKLSFRRLVKNPGFTAVAMLTMALCIGANLTIFAVVDAILVRSLPFPEADRLVLAYNSYPGAGTDRGEASLPNYFDRREGMEAFESIALIKETTSTVGAAGSPQRIASARITPEFFETLRTPLAMGRQFEETEMAQGSERVTIITDAFWQRHFNRDPQILGRTFQMNSAPATVIGVLPPGFRYLDSKAQIYRPLTHHPDEVALNQRHNNVANMVARLAPGVSLSEAQAQMNAFNAQQLTTELPQLAPIIANSGYHTKVVSLHGDHVSSVRPFLILLQIGVLFLLLIGAMNLTNLLFVRASGRFKELAVRQALGASRKHQARTVLMDTILLTLGGGLLGTLLAAVGIELIGVLGTDKLPLGASVAFDSRLALLAVLGSVGLGVCLAIPIIAFNHFYGNHPSHLQGESRTSTTISGIQRLRSGFSVVQVALAFVLLAGAGLLGASLKQVLNTPPGFDSEQVLTGQLSLPWKTYQGSEAQVAFVNRLLPALRALPGVSHAAIASTLPFTPEATEADSGITPEGYALAEGESLRTHYLSLVSPGYCQTMGMPLIEGRHLTDADKQSPVAVVDTAFAQHYWPQGDALGRRFCNDPEFKEENAITVIGVVGEVKRTDLAEADGHGAAYIPYALNPSSSFRVLLQTDSPSLVAAMVRQAIVDLDPELPISELKTMQAHIDDSLTLRRSPTVLASAFAGVALLLAALGIYGVLAYAVSQRRREIGVRMALGALPAQIRNQFLSVGMKVLGIGMLIGLAGIWATSRAMQSVLFEVPTFHWPTLAITIFTISGVTLIACLLPSDRAARLPPTEALR